VWIECNRDDVPPDVNKSKLSLKAFFMILSQLRKIGIHDSSAYSIPKLKF